MPWSVLIVDDDPFIRKLIATTLSGVAGVQLHEAGDGAQALAIAGQRSPALVFLDVDMPDMNGIDACRGLRALEQTREARIVMLTAGTEREHDAHEAGADLFLTKPFSPLELLRLVDELNAAGSSS
jgi:CheY-like chemotaxis protein